MIFRKLERLVVEGNVHLHGFAFLWGHCQNLKYMKLGQLSFYCDSGYLFRLLTSQFDGFMFYALCREQNNSIGREKGGRGFNHLLVT